MRSTIGRWPSCSYVVLRAGGVAGVNVGDTLEHSTGGDCARGVLCLRTEEQSCDERNDSEDEEWQRVTCVVECSPGDPEGQGVVLPFGDSCRRVAHDRILPESHHHRLARDG